MGFVELLLIGVGLSMDAFAVSICKGLSLQRASWRKAATVGLYFGVFQAVMPLTGYFFGHLFADYITAFDHWIAFVLLALIGANMIRESRGPEEELDEQGNPLGPASMFPLAVATSIDALAVGVTFAFLNVRILPAIAIIGTTTFTLSVAGVRIGNAFGARFRAKAELAGGLILIVMGLKILLEHLGILPL